MRQRGSGSTLGVRSFTKKSAVRGWRAGDAGGGSRRWKAGDRGEAARLLAEAEKLPGPELRKRLDED
jgi:hypothetical protein